MGTSRTVRFTVHYSVDHGVWTPGEWRMRPRFNGQAPAHGQATPENLKKHVEHVEASTQPGGVNAHIGVTKILSARIVDNFTGETLATYKA
jgi:hypothetical protein